MSYQIIDGKATSLKVQEEIAAEVESRVSSGGKRPHLAAVLIGDDPASKAYVGHKVKACNNVGFESSLVERGSDITEKEVLKIVDDLNNDDSIDGFIVQLPLPSHIDPVKVIEAVSPEKDVDGFHPVNVGKMSLGLPTFKPATPAGVMTLLEHYGIKTEGLHAVVVGRSDIVGNPMSALLRSNTEPGNCTVTQCHSRTKDLKSHTLQADLLITAIGKPHFITADMVKEGTIKRNNPIRVLRDNIVIYEGTLESLRRFKEDMLEVRQGIECGIGMKLTSKFFLKTMKMV